MNMKLRNARWTKVISLALATTTLAAAATTAVAQRQVPLPQSPFGFSQSRPRLVILLHGVTPEIYESPEQRIGSSAHARHYWGFDFIKGIQGRTDETKMHLVTPMANTKMRITGAEANDWRPETTDTNTFDFAPIAFPISWFSNVPPSVKNDQEFIKSYINLMTKTGADHTMVMINSRDGSKHFMPQLAETIEELYGSYTVAFGHLPEKQQPQIYLVGHSFGGIIARGIMANPTGGDLWGNKLTPKQRQWADYLRRRVVLINTLAAPHEGTFIGDQAGDVADFIIEYGPSIIFNFLNEINDLWFNTNKLSKAELKKITVELIDTALNAVSGKRDCLQDLLRMGEYNKGILHPNTAKRSPNGPLVPIFTVAGRNPGGTFIDKDRSTFYIGGSQWNPVTLIDLLRKGPREATEGAALYLINALMHYDGYGYEGKMPWGIAEHPEGDRVKGPFVGIGPNVERGLAAKWFPTETTLKGVINELFRGAPYEFNKRDGEWDSDGFLGFDSAHAYHLINQNYYRVFSQQVHGDMLPSDNCHHGSIMFDPGMGTWIHNEMVRGAGPIVGDTQDRRSIWHPLDIPEIPSNNLKVEIIELNNWKGDMDPNGADLSINVRIGAKTQTRHLGADKNLHLGLEPFYLENFAGSVVPIKIDCYDRDNPDPDDMGVMSPVPGKTSLHFYFDMRTGRIMGDITGEEGEIIVTKPIWWGVPHNVLSRIRVTRLP